MTEANRTKSYDQMGKYLSDHDPVGFLRLLGAVADEGEVEVEVIKSELITPARAVDGLYRVKDARGSRLTHGEIQTRWKGLVPPRVADYGARIYLLSGEVVESYVLVLTDKPAPPLSPPLALIQVGDLFIIKGYRLVLLPELEAKDWMSENRPYLLPFIPLMRGGEKYLPTVANALRMLPDEKQRSELTASFAIIGSLRYDRADIDRVLKEAFMRLPIEDIMRESSYVQAWHAQWREEGMEAGRAATVYEMVRRAAARYFPALEIGPELERVTNLEALEDLCLTMHELPDAAAVQARLKALLPTNGHVNGSES